MMYGLHEKYDGNAVCTVVCMSRKKNSKSTGHHNFFLLTFCQKKNPDAAYGGTKICSDWMDYNLRVSRCYGRN